jgi:sugar O-acyltransferase (sialic acid O-acetyltransferase NeuD family)
VATPFVIIGAGGFAREVLDVVEACQRAGADLEFLGFLADDRPEPQSLESRGVSWLGPPSGAELPTGTQYVVGVGSPVVRRALTERADAMGLVATRLIHPSATIGHGVVFDEGSIVCSHVSITTNVRIGRHVHLNLNSTVGHDAVIDPFVTVYPGVNISGAVRVGEGASLGTNSCVLQNLQVGAGSFVGAGSVVTRDVPPEVTVVGSPARPRPAAN